MSEEEKLAMRQVQLRVIERVAYLIVGTFIVMAILPIFVSPQEGSKELVSSMKDALVNITLLVAGFIFGSSFGSQSKDHKSPDTKETPGS